MSRWKVQLGAAIFLSAVLAFNVVVGNDWIGLIVLPTVISTTFQAGRTYSEYERAMGKPTFGKLTRPPGI